MNIQDAAKILQLVGEITPKIAKAAYRKAAMEYHPDRNPAGAEMMKIINAAYDVLKDYTGNVSANEQGTETNNENYSEAVNTALNAIIHLAGLNIEICGAWVWVSGDTRTHREVLKVAGFKYASKKKCWYFRPSDWRSASRGAYSMDEIRDKYGSSKPVTVKNRYLKKSNS
ncbi:molecular chaperone DnaJ [Candidatus Endobugula sertula]|uniref:Molecular chaperone DnaJ n=1 Tax=Candidatus Endobugula sertula TaxID=62101 RepID=A0A1D2QT65_9GAMM|nr:molecular chaperone DnaJ [Candidatus Endobugula sertula]